MQSSARARSAALSQGDHHFAWPPGSSLTRPQERRRRRAQYSPGECALWTQRRRGKGTRRAHAVVCAVTQCRPQTVTLQTLLTILNTTKSTEIPAVIKELSQDGQDTLMKYLYKGMAMPGWGDISGSVLLGWHEKVRFLFSCLLVLIGCVYS